MKYIHKNPQIHNFDCIILLIHSQINLIKLIWHISWIKNSSIKFDVYTTKLVWSNSSNKIKDDDNNNNNNNNNNKNNLFGFHVQGTMVLLPNYTIKKENIFY